MSYLARIAVALNRWTSRWVPSAFAIAIILTLITLAGGVLFTQYSLLDCIRFWGDGFWELLAFSMQMTLIILTGYIVVASPLVNRALRWFAGLPRNATSAVALTALGAMLLAWINWGLGLLGAAVLVKHVARRQPDVDYRLLVAVAYFGLGCTWHAGLSASAPVLVATPGHFMEKQMGVIPLSQTIFHPFNLTATLVVIVVMTLLAYVMHPRDPAQRKRVDPSKIQEPPASESAIPVEKKQLTLSTILDQTYFLNLLIGVCGLFWLFLSFKAHGWQGITINTVNFVFLTIGILLHPSPASVLKAAAESGSTIYNIALQFPFYSGMYGIIKGTALSVFIGQAFVRVASARTLPLIVYWYSGIVNYFVPSGGSKWAIEAPYVVQAAKTLGVGFDRIVVAYAWGDMMTDLLQPFWAIPLLAAAGLEFKEILGFEMIAFVLYAAVVSVFFYFLPFY